MNPDQLLKWRTDKGLTRKQMAMFIGIPEPTYKNWEVGDRKPGKAGERLLALVRKAEVFCPMILED